MPTGGHQSSEFIPFPGNRVVATITDSTLADIQALLQRGVDPARIDLLYEETGLHRLGVDGAGHGFGAQFQRTHQHAGYHHE